MAIRLMLSATLRRYVPAYNAETGCQVDVAAAATVRDLVRQVGIPERDVKIIMVDGIASHWDAALDGNERVALFPPVGGG